MPVITARLPVVAVFVGGLAKSLYVYVVVALNGEVLLAGRAAQLAAALV